MVRFSGGGTWSRPGNCFQRHFSHPTTALTTSWFIGRAGRCSIRAMQPKVLARAEQPVFVPERPMGQSWAGPPCRFRRGTRSQGETLALLLRWCGQVCGCGLGPGTLILARRQQLGRGRNDLRNFHLRPFQTYDPIRRLCAKNRNAFCLPAFNANGRFFSAWFLNRRSEWSLAKGMTW
jgi:hypothetical protein